MAQRKSFRNEISPAMQFISPNGADDGVHPAVDVPEGHKRNSLYTETKSKRVQLLLQPSLYMRVKEMAARRGVSVNELVHSILDDATGESVE